MTETNPTTMTGVNEVTTLNDENKLLTQDKDYSQFIDGTKEWDEYQAQLYDNRHMVAEYIAMGFAPTPVKAWGAEPLLLDWQTRRIGVADIDHFFPRGKRTNIGVLLGEPSGGLVHVNFDNDLGGDQAKYLAYDFLPPTRMKFGKASREACHWIYRVPNPGETIKLSADGFGCIVELRSTGQQSIFPGSFDEHGERLVFDPFNGLAFDPLKEPAVVTWEELKLGIVKIAFATILCERWDISTDHALPTIIQEFLAQEHGWPVEEVHKVIQAAYDFMNSDRPDYSSWLCRETLGHIYSERAVGDFDNWVRIGAIK